MMRVPCTRGPDRDVATRPPPPLKARKAASLLLPKPRASFLLQGLHPTEKRGLMPMPDTLLAPTVTQLLAMAHKRRLLGPHTETTWSAIVTAWNEASDEERDQVIASFPTAPRRPSNTETEWESSVTSHPLGPF